MVEDENSLKGHSEASNHSLQRQMGTNPLQRKRPDTKTTHTVFFFLLCQSLGFHQALSVLSYLYSGKLQNILFISQLFTCLSFICFLIPHFSFSTFDSFLLLKGLFYQG